METKSPFYEIKRPRGCFAIAAIPKDTLICLESSPVVIRSKGSIEDLVNHSRVKGQWLGIDDSLMSNVKMKYPHLSMDNEQDQGKLHDYLVVHSNVESASNGNLLLYPQLTFFNRVSKGGNCERKSCPPQLPPILTSCASTPASCSPPRSLLVVSPLPVKSIQFNTITSPSGIPQEPLVLTPSPPPLLTSPPNSTSHSPTPIFSPTSSFGIIHRNAIYTLRDIQIGEELIVGS